MIKDERGNILCENHEGKRQHLNPSVVKNAAWMKKYKWEPVNIEAPPVNKFKEFKNEETVFEGKITNIATINTIEDLTDNDNDFNDGFPPEEPEIELPEYFEEPLPPGITGTKKVKSKSDKPKRKYVRKNQTVNS